MENLVAKIQELLNRRAELQARLNLLPYDGTPEIKIISNKRYLYIRKRELGKVKSTYVGEYSEELYTTLLRNNVEAKAIKKEIRQIEKDSSTSLRIRDTRCSHFGKIEICGS